MSPADLCRRARSFLLISVILAGAAGLPAVLSNSAVPVAEATVAQTKDRDDKKSDDKKSAKNQGSDDADHVLNAQVLEINTLKDPPELVVGSLDGQTVVRVLKTDEIAINGVRLGDFIEARGEKQSEELFEATLLTVSEHFKASKSGNDNKSKKR